jgi:hypothetical protein
MCYDSKGYEFLDGAQQVYFRESCQEEYTAYQELQKKMDGKEGADTVVAKSVENGDASSIKYLRMMTTWADKMASLKERSLIRNINALDKTNNVVNYLSGGAPWEQTEVKSYELYRFTIKDLKTSAMLSGAAAGALISAGAVAIAGGFATASTLSAWAAAGIITASTLAGAGGFWLLGALRGAWQAKTPTINDSFVKGRESYKCGKKSQCSDFKRVLKQPYNAVCGIHASSNACVKHFLVTTESTNNFNDTMSVTNTMNSERTDVADYFDQVMALGDGNKMYFIIDPWVPEGMTSNQIIGGQPVYTTLLENGFKDALSYLKGNKPSGNQKTQYLQKNVIGSKATSHYAPKLADQPAYNFSADEKAAFMTAARKYAVDEGFFADNQQQFLDDFAEYTYKYHFMYPKATPVSEGNIAYPPPGLSTYAGLLQFGLARVTKVNGDEYRNLLDMQINYRNILTDRLKLYRDNNQLPEEELNAVNGEIEKLQGELEELQGFQGIVTNLSSGNVKTTNLAGGANALVGNISSSSLTSKANGQAVVNSLRTLGELKKKSQQEQEAYNKRMSGNEARQSALETAQQAMVDSFYNPLGNSKSSFFADAGQPGTERDKKDSNTGSTSTALNLPGSAATGSGTYGSGQYGNSLGLNKGGGSSSISEDGGLGIDIGAGAFNADTASQGQISAAIRARDNQPRNKYQPNEKDSLFDILTKAYIRNYDKVLMKKNQQE